MYFFALNSRKFKLVRSSCKNLGNSFSKKHPAGYMTVTIAITITMTILLWFFTSKIESCNVAVKVRFEVST